MAKREPDIPVEFQPKPSDYAFDLARALQSVVFLRSTVPSDAFTASSLGTERAGSAVMIQDGLLLTIGYLITEAEQIWLTTYDGRTAAGHALAYDNETGFGLVQVLGKLNIPKLELGASEQARAGMPGVMAAGGGAGNAVATKIAARQEFAGYWEYLIEDAIFTTPAHPFWGGAALIGEDGKLLGVGSLVLQQGDGRGGARDLNMVVPVEMLRPVMSDLISYGRSRRQPRPWLGLYATTDDDTLVVGGLADGGPAEQAGLRAGDRVLAVEDRAVTDLAELWRAVWAAGSAGTPVRLRVGRGARETTVTVTSGDRTAFLKAPRLH